MKRHVDPLPLKLIIHKITNIVVPKPEGAEETDTKNFAVLSATFFSKSNSAFVGRTFKTKPIELVYDQGNSSYATLDFHASYFYSQVDNHEDVVLVLDLEVKSNFSLLSGLNFRHQFGHKDRLQRQSHRLVLDRESSQTYHGD